MNEILEKLGQNAKNAEVILRNLSTNDKNRTLETVAQALVDHTEEILEANALDVENGKNNQMPEGLIDRLMLNAGRIEGMADGLRQLVGLEDPIGEVTGMKKRPNGLLIGQKRVPLGVIGIIYEARPNVTSDAFGLCFKTGNVVILKGGSDAIHSNTAIVKCIREALVSVGITENAIQLIEDTSRETAAEFMKMNQYVDVLIPRGGRGLIKAVVNQSTIPVIETGTGNCHIYVDETADLQMAADIVINAKTQRVGVCNACESLLVNRKVKDAFLPVLAERLKEKHVEVRADKDAGELMPGAVAATEEDWGTEYLDYILSVKVVDSVDDAICRNYLCTILTDNEEIKRVNTEFRNIQAPTDVLSFPMIPFETPADYSVVEEDESYFDLDSDELLLGDIMISVPKVFAQAEEYGHSVTREFCFLVAHSMLHLLGYDHMTEDEAKVMEAKQASALKELGINR
jgi:glutamate-5-semialdehyde dehydrogenase